MDAVRIGRFDEFVENEPTQVDSQFGPLCVVRTAKGFRVLSDTCSHETTSLSDGEYYDDSDEIECPLHASTFDCSSGMPTGPPATAPVTAYTVTVVGDDVMVTP